MVVQASVKTPKNFKRPTPTEKNTWNSQVRKPVSYKDSGDDDHVALSTRLLRMSNLGRCNSKCVDDSVKKRLLANSNSLHISDKKSKVSVSLYDDNDNGDIPISLRIKRSCISADNSVPAVKKFMEKKHALVEKSIVQGQKKKRVQEQRLKKDIIDKCSKELGNKKMQVHNKVLSKIEECVKDLVIKEAQLCFMDNMIGERKQELKAKEIELHQVNDTIVKDHERKEEELQILSQKLAECDQELKIKEEEIAAVKNLISGQAKELESERKKLLKVMSIRRTDPHAQMKDIESMKKSFEGQVKELETKVMQFEGQMKGLKSKQTQLESQVKESESRVEEFDGQIKELKSEMKHYESQLKEIASTKKQLEHQVREFQTKKEELQGQKKELESQKKHFQSQVKELESQKKHFETQAKELESKEIQLESLLKEFESKEEKFNGKVKVFKSKRKHFKSRAKKLKTKKKQLEERVRELESKEMQLEDQMKEIQTREDLKSRNKPFVSQVEDFKLDEEQLEGLGKELGSKVNKFEEKVKDLESKPNKVDGHLKNFGLREKQFEFVLKSFEEDKESGNQSSPIIDGRDFQLLPSDQMEEIESLNNDIVVELLASSPDPSKVALDIIQNPIVQQYRKGDAGVNIDGSHIVVLKHLMRISPDIRPIVREEALKLALDLKANMSEDTENSLVVLAFLLLVSIYGLVPSFDKDELFELLGFAVQHKIAVELFETLGFGDKISDLVQNLIAKQQYIEAVRFICAYNLVDKHQIVDLL